jgi:hypothetical protein
MNYLHRRKALPAELVLRVLSCFPAVEHEGVVNFLPDLVFTNLRPTDAVPLNSFADANLLVTVLK